MADPTKRISNRAAKAKAPSDAEQKRQEQQIRDELEDDEVKEALRILHHDQDVRRR